jgi:rubrerythrin
VLLSLVNMTNGQMINISKIKRLPLRGTDCTQQCDGGTMLAQTWITVDVRNEERARRDYVSAAAPKSESDIILRAIAREKESYAYLAAAARTCTSAKARRLYNQLALDELKHLLSLVSVMDGLADDCLAQLDLTFPMMDLPDPLPQSEDGILRSTMVEEQRSQQLVTHLAEGVDREELVALLEVLRAEEEDHLARLRSMLYGLEAGRPVVAKWLRSIHRLVPTGSLH